MKTCICYDINDLLKLLPGYSLKEIKSTHESEDETSKSIDMYFSCRDDIVSITHYYGIWSSVEVKYADGKSVHLHTNNVTSKSEELLYISTYKDISPRLTVSSGEVQHTETLATWLKNMGITEEQLKSIEKEFKVYEVISYPGVVTPVRNVNCTHFAYSSETLKLDEREIAEVLNSIEDELLREKINCILYARVFKRGY